MHINSRRRNLMKALPATSLGMGLGLPLASSAAVAPDPWLQAQAIVRHLARVGDTARFRRQDFVVTKFGARPCKLTRVKAWVSFEGQDTIDTPAAKSPDCYPAFKAAIKACHDAGGGRVVIPAGNWYCAGPIVLLSNVHVHLAKDAHIYFSHNPADYAKYGDIDCGANGKLVISRWQSNDCLNYSPMVYAYGQDNVALTGEDWTSVLDGQGGVPFNEAGDCWWTWKGKQKTINSIGQGNTPNFRAGMMSENTENPNNARSLADVAPHITDEERQLIEGEDGSWRTDAKYLPALSEAGVPTAKRVFGIGHYLRPPMIQLVGCTNVLLQGYHVMRTPFWMHHPVHCRNLVIRKVHCESHGPNSDGFDPEACDHVLVEGCTFDTGDDCIAIKAGKNQDTQWGPSQNIVIQDCIMHSGHGAVTLGSEMAAGIQNVYAQKLVFQNANWKTNPLNIAIRLKTNLNRGGYLRNFYVRDVDIPNGVQLTASHYATFPDSPIQGKQVATAAGAVVAFDCDYIPTADHVRTRPPVVNNIHISNVRVGNVNKDGKTGSCFQAIMLLGPVASDYNGPQPAPPVVPITDVTITDCDFGTPTNSAEPWFVYNVKNVALKNVKIGGKVHNTTLNAPANATT